MVEPWNDPVKIIRYADYGICPICRKDLNVHKHAFNGSSLKICHYCGYETF
jgi:hypothetical protein